MDRPVQVDLFVEDHAHEQFLKALVNRVAREHHKSIQLSVRSARGGHGRALTELSLYQKAVGTGVGGLAVPDLVVIGIDGNCQTYQVVRRAIAAQLDAVFRDKAVIACPDPHIERWFLADTNAFNHVVGCSPKVRQGKCQRDYYKTLLLQAIIDAGHVPTLGGIEFAGEIAEAMDIYRAGKIDKSLKIFLDDLGAFLQHI